MASKNSRIAKISPPDSSGALPRRRLFRLLDASSRKSVVWVSGPAGSGKTTLVSSYLKGRKLPCLWYQVDESDSDISSFFYYMGLAARKAAPRRKKQMPLLTSEYLQGIAAFTRRYFEELCSRLNPPFYFVFDNYQDVPGDADFHAMLCEGLEAIPDGVNVICISRSDAPRQFARLRANGKFAEIGWKDLSFTLQECRAFLKKKDCKALSAETVEVLHDKTGGWAAGLVLMTEMAKTKDIPYSLVSELSQEAVFNYFANEIFEKTDGKTCDFLLKTSFFPSMSAAAAKELTGNPEAQSLLSRLNRNHYFTDLRDPDKPVFQYHHLFREFLRLRAKDVLNSQQLAAIQRSTANILEKEDRIEEAAALFINAGNYEELAALVYGHAQELLTHGMHNSLREWIESIPDGIMQSAPWLLYWLGMCRMPYDPPQSRGLIERAFILFEAQRNATGIFLSWSGIIETFGYEWGNFFPVDRWIGIMEDFLSHHPRFPSPEIEARVAAGMFSALTWRRPLHPDLPKWADKIMQIVMHSQNNQLRIMLGNNLLFYYLWSEDSAKAAVVINTLKPLSRAAGNAPLTQVMWCLMQAMYAWLMNDRATCIAAVAEGRQVAGRSGAHLLDELLLSMGFECSMTVGDCEKAAVYLDEIAALNITRLLDRCQYQHLCASIAWGRRDWQNALRHGENAIKLVEASGHYLGQSVMEHAQAVALYDMGRKADAEIHLARALRSCSGIRRVEFCCKLYQALFALESGKEEEGLAFLREAMSIGARHGYLNFIRWNSDVMSRLCGKALEYDIEPDYVRKIIKAHNLLPPEQAAVHESWPYPIKIYTLGNFRILKNDEPVEFTGKVQQKPLAMLKALIAFGGRDVPERQLIDILWPDAAGDSAHKSHEVTLLRLRRLLGREDVIQLKGGLVSLDSRYCWVDARAIEDMAEDVMKLWTESGNSDGIDAEAVRKAERTIGMYKGHFLPAEAELQWTASLREKIRNKVLAIVSMLGRHWEEAGKWDRVLECFQKGLEIDNLSEEFYQHLMICYEKLGRNAEAAKTYLQCRETLSCCLDIPPSDKTEAIYRRIGRKQ